MSTKRSPLQCAKCQKYGHTLTRCSAGQHTCRKCSLNHPSWECQNDVTRCVNCQGEHKSGSMECPKRKEQEAILALQQRKKIGRAKAMHIQKQLQEETNGRETNEKYLEIGIGGEARKKVCPFRVERWLKSKYNIGREDINADARGYVVKVTTEQQTNRLLSMKSILEIPCEVQLHGSFNESKELVYMQEFDIFKDAIVESFKAGLVKRYDIKEVIPASWIVPKSSYSKPFLLTFTRSIPPAFIEVPGEAENIKVYEYKQKPLFCANCLEYTHSKRNCKNSKRCQLCLECHADQQCTKTAAICYHCKQDHKVGDSRCPIQQQEEEICNIQNKEKIPWRLARQQYFT